MKFRSLNLVILASLFFSSFVPITFVSAQIKFLPTVPCQKKLGISCPQVATNAQAQSLLRTVITYPLGIFLSLLSLLALIMIVYAGIKYILARGDEKEVEEAKRILIYTVIGLVVVAFAGILVNSVMSVIFNP